MIKRRIAKMTDYGIKALKNKSGKVLNDGELVEKCLEKIEEFTSETGQPPPIEPKFCQWLKECKEYIESGGDAVSFKKKNVLKTISDYSDIIKNTEKMNKKLNL